MSVELLTIEEKRTFVKCVEAGLYPFSLQGGGFTFMIDDKGLWYGHKEPNAELKSQVDNLVEEFKVAL